MRLPAIFKRTTARLKETDRTAILVGVISILLWLAQAVNVEADKGREPQNAAPDHHRLGRDLPSLQLFV
jgi:hypothetical protein